MRHVILISTLAVAPSFGLAQSTLDPNPQESEEQGRSLMERGAELFFEGLKREMEPALDDLRGMAEQVGPSLRQFWVEMGPALGDLAGEIKDWTDYHPPEILPNGDIIMRKRTPLPDPTPEDQQLPEGVTDL